MNMRRTDHIQSYVSIPRALHERMTRHKERNERTMNREIIYLLTRALEMEEAKEKVVVS